MELAAGVLIRERYRLERLIGQGGMGVVWAGEDVVAHGPVALKFLQDGAGDPDAAKRLMREARAVSAVRHPNVVQTLEVLELEDGSPVLIMELLTGESLRELLQRTPRLSLRELAEIMVPVVSAVGAAHALGIVHRDLKPENIFVARSGPDRIVKILDFGIAKLTALDGDAMRSTGNTTGAVLGTPAYMAPEQVFGESDLDHRADIWALGLILYQGLSGVLPTEGTNVGQVLKNVLARPFEPLEQLVPEVPAGVARLVARMLSRERSDRPEDLREVLEILAPHAGERAPDFGPPAAAIPIAAPPTAVVHTDVAMAPTLREPPRRRLPGRRAAGGAVAALAAAGLAVLGWPRSSPPVRPPAVVRSPLDAPDSRLACPILAASGVDGPAGWLGAAAAATVCERARVILGGRPERTLVPAELLDLPRRPVDDFPADRYDADDARPSSLAQARRRASAYLAGSVARTPRGFEVALEFDTADGVERARSAGSGPGLSEAVRAAMTPLVRPDLLAMATRLDPVIAAWERTSDVEAALARLDVNLAMAQNAGRLEQECDRFAQVSSRAGELGPAWRWLCAFTMGRQPTKVALDEADQTPPGIATRWRLRHFLERNDAPGTADRLHALYEGDTTSWGRSLLAATEACVAQPVDPRRAAAMAIIAVEQEPKNPSGERCNPWGELVAVMRDTPSPENVLRAMRAWVPWSSISWSMQARTTGDPVESLIPWRRAYAMSPFDTSVADGYASALLAAGKIDDARGVARTLGTGHLPVHVVESDLLELRIEASQAQFRTALDQARTALDSALDDAGWVRAQRLEIAGRALELASILGTAHAEADELVVRFVDPYPTVLDGAALASPATIAAICGLASPGPSARCFAQVRALREQLSAGVTHETDQLLRGAESYATHDFAEAATAWRPLLRGSATLAAALPDAMAEVFNDTGDLELAERVDRTVMEAAPRLGGATLGHVRAARRAARRGQAAVARDLASGVIRAWQFADELPPAVTEMRRLLEQLRTR
jgi:hypothetical protein